MDIDSLDIHRQQDALRQHASNLARMLDLCRAMGRSGNSGFTQSVVSMTANSFRNALDAMQATVDEVETECLLICAQRESGNPVFDLTQRLPSPRPSAGLPATVSPCAAE